MLGGPFITFKATIKRSGFLEILLGGPYRAIRRVIHGARLRRSFLYHKSHLRMTLLREKRTFPGRHTVLISQLVHMGDIIACEPVVRHVRRSKPDAFIIMAVHQKFRELADSHPEINYTLPLTCISEWAKYASAPFVAETIDLNIYGRECYVCGVRWLKSGDSRGVTSANYYHYGSLLEAFTTGAGITVDAVSPRVYPQQKDRDAADKLGLPARFVCVHAGANEPERLLHMDKWLAIIKHLNDRWNVPVVEIGLKPIIRLNAPNKSLPGRESILQSAEVIRRSVLYLGCDSGPAHLAHGVGAYGVIFLGEFGNFRRYMPYTGDYALGINSELLYHDGPVANLPTDVILAAVDRRMNAVLIKG
jgi:ADP-heptose:LPS heptosyltransferase